MGGADFKAPTTLLQRRWNVGGGGPVLKLPRARSNPRPFFYHQLHQLPLGENPTGDDHRDDEKEGFWQNEHGIWTTDFSPPTDFDGVEDGTWRGLEYRRACSDQEAIMLDRLQGLDRATARAAADWRRDRYIADMMAELAEQPDLPPAPPAA